MRRSHLIVAALLTATAACHDTGTRSDELDVNDGGVVADVDAGVAPDADCQCSPENKPAPTPTPTPTPIATDPGPTPTPSPTPDPGPTPTPWDKKGDDCPGDYKAPAGCIKLGDTDDWDMNWMECHRQQPSGVATNWDFTWTGCDISSDDQKSIVADCKAKYTSVQDILVCLGRGIKDKLKDDKSNVCRHHAMCGYKLAGLAGYPQDFRCGHDHCWTEVASKTGTYILDPYNGIYYWCPK